MTLSQIGIVCLLLLMFLLFAHGRIRVELVASGGLGVAFLLGLVPTAKLFSGFSNPAVVTVAEVLLIVSVLARVQVIERVAELVAARLQHERAVLVLLCGVGGLVSVFMNNIGALALMIPPTLSVCRRLGIAPGRVLMPLSFATLLGGICSLTGTPANLVVNEWAVAQTGHAFSYFALGKVGFPLLATGVLWMAWAAPGVLRRMATPSEDRKDETQGTYLCELVIPRGSPLAGVRLTDAEQRYLLRVHGVVREDARVFARRETVDFRAGDILLTEARLEDIDRLYESGAVRLAHAEHDRVEAVVMPDSLLLGSRVGSLEFLDTFGVGVMSLSSRRRRVEGRFSDIQVGLGDVLVLAGDRSALREATSEAGLLPLMARALPAVRPDAYLSAGVFALGVLATALGLAPPEVAFGAVVLALAVMGSLKLREALQEVNWTILILLACMIPLGTAVAQTGAARVIANTIVDHLPTTAPMVVIATTLALAAAITPFVDNVSTAAVLSPIAAGVSARAGVPIEPLLAAIAVGASLDFLTPFGHHNNTVVMGMAGYRFVDFPRLGLPLLGLCLGVALLVFRLVWF